MTDRWRLRVGDYRLQYTREGRRITLLSVLNRRDAYDD